MTRRWSIAGWVLAVVMTRSLAAQDEVKMDKKSFKHDAPAPGRLLPAPPPPTSDRPESVTVVPGPKYGLTGLRRTLLGPHYRDLWLTPIRVPVLDMARFGGGLTPVEEGGGLQTVSLHTKGGDGNEYVLRSVDKNPHILPAYDGRLARQMAKDEMSAVDPSGSLVVAPLLQAAGVLHVTPALYVVPDDPRLGEYRTRFAGMLAEVEQRPKSDDEAKVATTEKLMADLDKDAHARVDARAYLTARLMDMYVGDWDRDESQWRWQRFGDKDDHVWKPIPLDRDWALSNSDGLFAAMSRGSVPSMITFEDHYPRTVSLLFEERKLDARLLGGLDRPTWDSVAQWLHGALTDSVIDDAVAHMPPEQLARRGDFFRKTLRARRENLPALASAIYRVMAERPDVHTAAQSLAVAIRVRPDTVDIRMRIPGDSAAVYDRRFVRHETKEVRLYLDGGPDSVVLIGAKTDHSVPVRVIVATKGSVMADSSSDASAWTKFYDHRWTPDDTLWRDVGSHCAPSPSVFGGTDIGLSIGATYTCETMGFRREPFALSQSIGLHYATAPGGGTLTYLGQIRPPESSVLFALHASAVSAEFTRYFGFGNHTTYDGTADFYRARQSYFEVEPTVGVSILPNATLTVGPDVRYHEAGHLGGTYFATTQPYGVGPFGTVSGVVSATYDSRDMPAYARHGLYVDLAGRGVPALWNATDAYGSLRGVAATYLTADKAPLTPTLALRAGGTKVWGEAPYQDLAHIGTSEAGEAFSVRGLLPNRFTGDASVFGNAQLELVVTRLTVVVPTDVGILALNDFGRVFTPGDHSNVWHDGYGGGVFAAAFKRHLVFHLTIAHSSDGTQVYFGGGTGF